MNRQEAFNKIYTHAQQKRKSFDEINLKCLYRGPNGAKCFIGCLIPDEVCPDKVDYGVAITDILKLCGIDLGSIARDLVTGEDERTENFYFYNNLQQIHDNHSPQEWNYLLQEFAKAYELTIPSV